MSDWEIQLPNASGVDTWYDLDTLGLKPLAWSGIGMPPIQNHYTEYAMLDGAFFQGVKASARMLILSGIVAGNVAGGGLGDDFDGMLQARQVLIDAFKPSGGSATARKVRYAGNVDSGAATGEKLELTVYYDDGLQFDGGNVEGFTERVFIPLIAVDPFWYGGSEQSDSLDSGDTIASEFIRPTTAGWDNMSFSTGVNYAHQCAAVDPVTGDFVEGEYDSTASDGRLQIWDAGTDSWASTATIASHRPAALHVNAASDIYVAFDDTTGAAITNVRYYDGSWNDLGDITGSGGDPAAILYVPGLGTLVAEGTTLYKHNGSSWSAWVTADATIRALALDGLDTVYVGGSFDNIASTATGELAKYTVSSDTWAAVGATTGGSDYVSMILPAQGQPLFVAGSFTTIGGVTLTNAAFYNGHTFTSINLPAGWTFVSPPDGDVGRWNDGTLWANLQDSASNRWLNRYNGTTWLRQDYRSSSEVVAGGSSTLVLYSRGSSHVVGGDTTITYNGTADAHPYFEFVNGQSANIDVYYIENALTGKTIYLDLTIAPGETVTLRTGPLASGQERISSNYRGPIPSAVLPGSQLASFALSPARWVPGGSVVTDSNVIMLYATDVNLTSTMKYLERHWSADGMAER